MTYNERLRALINEAIAELKKKLSQTPSRRITIVCNYVYSYPLVRFENCGDENWRYYINTIRLNDKDELELCGIADPNSDYDDDDDDEPTWWSLCNVMVRTDLLNVADEFLK